MAKTDDNKSSKTRMRSFLEAVKECKEIKEMFGTLINNYNDDSLVENTLQRFTSKTGFIYRHALLARRSNNNVDSLKPIGIFVMSFDLLYIWNKF